MMRTRCYCCLPGPLEKVFPKNCSTTTRSTAPSWKTMVASDTPMFICKHQNHLPAVACILYWCILYLFWSNLPVCSRAESRLRWKRRWDQWHTWGRKAKQCPRTRQQRGRNAHYKCETSWITWVQPFQRQNLACLWKWPDECNSL